MSEEITIVELKTGTANTRDGEKEVWYVTDANQTNYSSFKGKWNADWKVGSVIKAETSTREYNGKTYHSLKCPAELKSQGFGGGMNGQKLDNLASLLQSINDKLEVIVELAKQKPTPSQDEDIPF